VPLTVNVASSCGGGHLIDPGSAGTLFEECGDALVCIVGRDDASESGFLNRQPIVDRRIHAAMDGRQSSGKRERRL
jgi:hypothetical protein